MNQAQENKLLRRELDEQARLNGMGGEREARLMTERNAAMEELKNIANANPSEWDDPSDFEAWAKSRARFILREYGGKP